MPGTGLVHTLRGLLAYTIWADRQILEALAEVPADDLARDTGASFGSVLGTMTHILAGEQLWLSRFVGAPLERLPTVEDYPDLPALAAGFTELWPQLEYVLASLTQEQVAGDFSWVSTHGESRTAPYRQVLLHFVNHATYHRGQVVALLRQLGHAPPSTDLVYWRGAL
jgi:uncharacterized damage-inducible protein DinB